MAQLPAPWMLGATEVNDIPMLIVHMSNGELEGLDDLQGGPSVDESTGIREYSQLADIIEIPEIRAVFHRIADEFKENGGKPSAEVSSAYKTAKQYSLPYRETDEEEHNPLKALEHKGRDGDTKLAELPINFVEFLIELEHVPSVNPKTELLEFGFFNEFLRAVGTIGGALLGGPIGAGAGRALAGAATGQKLGNAAMAGLKTGTLAYGAQGLGQAAGLSGSTPMTGGFFGGSNMLGSALGGLGKMAGFGSGTMPAPTVATPTPANIPAPQQEIVQTQPGFFDHILGTAGKLAPFAPLAMAGLSYMGEKKYQKHLEKERERQEAKWDKERKQLGWDANWTPVTSKKYEPNPEFVNRNLEDIRHGRFGGPSYREIGTSGKFAKGGLVQSYTEGTLVRGSGKGQDDKIETSVPEGSYIIDASATSMFGDGSSTAGAKVLKEFETNIKKKAPKQIVQHVSKVVKKQSQQVPVWLSDSEYKFDPTTVTLLGSGSNEKGANILRNAVKNIRKHKTAEGDGLPPKAKPLLAYLH